MQKNRAPWLHETHLKSLENILPLTRSAQRPSYNVTKSREFMSVQLLSLMSACSLVSISFARAINAADKQHKAHVCLTPSTPPVPNCCCSKGPVPYWSNPPFLIFDIWVLWRSLLSARAPKCQKLKMVG